MGIEHEQQTGTKSSYTKPSQPEPRQTEQRKGIKFEV